MSIGLSLHCRRCAPRRGVGNRRRVPDSRSTSRSWRSPATARRRRRGAPARRRDDGICHRVRRRRPVVSRRTRRGCREPPRRSRRRPGADRGSAAIGDRSTPLLLPPAIRTSESKARIAADAACGVVALESLNQLTPLRLADRLEAVGRRLRTSPAPRRSRRAVAETGLEHERRRRQGVGDVVRQPAAASSRPRRSYRRDRPASSPREAVVGARTPERHVAAGATARCASRSGRRRIRSPRPPAAGGRRGAPWRPRRWPSSVPVEMVGREVEPHRGVGTELLRPRQAEAAALDDERVELVIAVRRRRRRAARRCCRAPRCARRRRAGSPP